MPLARVLVTLGYLISSYFKQLQDLFMARVNKKLYVIINQSILINFTVLLIILANTFLVFSDFYKKLKVSKLKVRYSFIRRMSEAGT